MNVTILVFTFFEEMQIMNVQRILYQALASVVLIVSGNAMAVDGTPSAPQTTAGVMPFIIPGANPGGNRTCAEVGAAFYGNATYFQCWSGKRDPGDFALGFVDISGNESCDQNLISASNDGTYVEFTAVPDGVGAAIIKGGSGGGNVYVYDPQILSDSALASPPNPNGIPAGLSHVDAFCWNPVDVVNYCYEEDTAWSDGDRYVKKGNWATFTRYSNQPIVKVLFAGQTKDAGDVSFSAPVAGIVTITIELNASWRFALNPVGDDNGTPVFDNNVKVQHYSAKPAAKNPAPGLFQWKKVAQGQFAQIEVPAAAYYGVHVDVEQEVDCPDTQ
jgi:hypothetical protein